MKLTFMAFFLLTANACQHSEHKPGVRSEYFSFIPARISVLPAIAWPENISHDTPKGIASNTSLFQEALAELDQHILSSLADQPYIHGFTPRVVKTLASEKTLRYLRPDFFWKGITGDANQNEISVYDTQIAEHPMWRQWLAQLSIECRHSDAALLPLIVSVEEKQFDDRGFRTSQRMMKIVMFLIDSQTAKLIWAGQSEGLKTSQSPDKTFPAYPDWKIVKDMVFAKQSLWKDFPGRLPVY